MQRGYGGPVMVVTGNDVVPPNAPTLYTVGHGRLSFAELVALLGRASITALVDVRTVPKSRSNPQTSRDELAANLPQAGIEYRWEPHLGGFRKPRPDSSNTYWRHPSFRGYADYMQSAEFWGALDNVLGRAREVATAVMCSETVWWRCHRRLIADAAVLGRGARVLHVFHDGRLAPHPVSEGARFAGGKLSYPGDPELSL